MKAVLISSSLIALFTQSFGQQWTKDPTTAATMVVGVGAASDTFAAAAGGSNGSGEFVEIFDGESWTKNKVNALLLLDSAASPSGGVVATSTYNVYLSNDKGSTFTALDSISGASQSANVYGANKENIALVGTFETQDPSSKRPVWLSGVAISTNGGSSFSVSEVPAGYTRYGAFPSDNVWYISSGIWGDDPAAKSKILEENSDYRLTSRFTAVGSKEMKMKSNVYTSAKHDASTNTTGWFRQKAKCNDLN